MSDGRAYPQSGFVQFYGAMWQQRWEAAPVYDASLVAQAFAAQQPPLPQPQPAPAPPPPEPAAARARPPIVKNDPEVRPRLRVWFRLVSVWFSRTDRTAEPPTSGVSAAAAVPPCAPWKPLRSDMCIIAMASLPWHLLSLPCASLPCAQDRCARSSQVNLRSLEESRVAVESLDEAGRRRLVADLLSQLSSVYSPDGEPTNAEAAAWGLAGAVSAMGAAALTKFGLSVRCAPDSSNLGRRLPCYDF